MTISTLVGAVLGIAGGCGYASSVLLNPIAEQMMIRLTACVCYSRISKDDEVFWEDLKSIYGSETKRLTGISGFKLQAYEGHEVVERLKMLCARSRPASARWEVRLADLTRSLPQDWVITAAGEGFYPKIFGVVMLLGQIGVLASLMNRLPADYSPLWMAVMAGVPAIFFSISGLPSLYTALRATKQVRQLERAITGR